DVPEHPDGLHRHPVTSRLRAVASGAAMTRTVRAARPRHVARPGTFSRECTGTYMDTMPRSVCARHYTSIPRAFSGYNLDTSRARPDPLKRGMDGPAGQRGAPTHRNRQEPNMAITQGSGTRAHMDKMTRTDEEPGTTDMTPGMVIYQSCETPS